MMQSDFNRFMDASSRWTWVLKEFFEDLSIWSPVWGMYFIFFSPIILVTLFFISVVSIIEHYLDLELARITIIEFFNHIHNFSFYRLYYTSHRACWINKNSYSDQRSPIGLNEKPLIVSMGWFLKNFLSLIHR